jgi:hypothetical protein
MRSNASQLPASDEAQHRWSIAYPETQTRQVPVTAATERLPALGSRPTMPTGHSIPAPAELWMQAGGFTLRRRHRARQPAFIRFNMQAVEAQPASQTTHTSRAAV